MSMAGMPWPIASAAAMNIANFIIDSPFGVDRVMTLDQQLMTHGGIESTREAVADI